MTPEQKKAIAIASARKRQAEGGQPADADYATPGGFKTAVGLGLSGGQIPFGNVLTSRLAAEATAPFLSQEGEGWREAAGRLYSEAQDFTRATQEANPGGTALGNVAGVLTTLPAAFTKGGAGLQGARVVVTEGARKGFETLGKLATYSPFTGAGRLAAAGNLGTRALGRAAVAAPVAGAYAAGEALPGERQEAFQSGAGMGAGAAVAMPLAIGAVTGTAKGIGNMATGFGARGEDALNIAEQNIAQRSTKAYAKMREIGTEFIPQASNKIIQRLDDVLAKDGPLNPKLHDKTIAALDNIKETGFKTLEELDQWRQVLNDVAGNFSDKVNARKAKLLIGAIDDATNDLNPNDLTKGGKEAVDALFTGRKEWQRLRKFESIASIVKNADGDANKLKRDLERFRQNPKKTGGWSKPELEALKFASSQTTGEGVLKTLGKFGFDLGSGRAVGNTALPVIGAAATGIGTQALGPAAAVPIIGTAARLGQKGLAFGKTEKLLQLIEGGQVEPTIWQRIMQLPPKVAEEEIDRLSVFYGQSELGRKMLKNSNKPLQKITPKDVK